jgi:hypothetical protein
MLKCFTLGRIFLKFFSTAWTAGLKAGPLGPAFFAGAFSIRVKEEGSGQLLVASKR